MPSQAFNALRFVYDTFLARWIGGEICQSSNLIFWLILHSPLEVIDRRSLEIDLSWTLCRCMVSSIVIMHYTIKGFGMKRWFLVIALSVVGIVGIGVFMHMRHAPERALADGMSAYESGQFEAAITSLDAYLSKRPSDDVAWTVYGNAMTKLKRFPEAETSYLTALKIDNRNVKALNGMGVLCRQRGDVDEAVSYYRKALGVQSDYVPPYLCLATIEMERKNYALALKYTRRAHGLNDDDPTATAYLAVAYHLNGMFKKRDEYTAKARTLGYVDMDGLARIYEKEKGIQKPTTSQPETPADTP